MNPTTIEGVKGEGPTITIKKHLAAATKVLSFPNRDDKEAAFPKEDYHDPEPTRNDFVIGLKKGPFPNGSGGIRGNHEPGRHGGNTKDAHGCDLA